MTRMMLTFSLLAASLGFAQETPKPAPARKPKPQHAATQPVPKAPELKRHPDGRPLGIPHAAVKVGPVTWKIVEDGKPVIYRQTAFGFAKLSVDEDARIQRLIDGRPEEKAEIPEGLSVKEKNGKLEFTRVTPFGPYVWTRDKNELTASESALWQRTQKEKSSASEVRP